MVEDGEFWVWVRDDATIRREFGPFTSKSAPELLIEDHWFHLSSMKSQVFHQDPILGVQVRY
jgi:hypothetical protein